MSNRNNPEGPVDQSNSAEMKQGTTESYTTGQEDKATFHDRVQQSKGKKPRRKS